MAATAAVAGPEVVLAEPPLLEVAPVVVAAADSQGLVRSEHSLKPAAFDPAVHLDLLLLQRPAAVADTESLAAVAAPDRGVVSSQLLQEQSHCLLLHPGEFLEAFGFLHEGVCSRPPSDRSGVRARCNEQNTCQPFRSGP